jgi:hypothetical protein
MDDDSPDPNPASKPPEDVLIPEESVYGSNEPLPPPETSTPKSGFAPTSQPQPQNASIRIGLIPALLLLGLLLLASSGVGYFLSQAPIPEPNTQTENNTQNKKTKTSNQTPSQNSAFTPDRGIYKKNNTIDAKSLAKKRIDMAKKQIIWITDTPDSIHVLPALSAKKNKDPIQIFILTGQETSQHRISSANEYNIPLNQLNLELESPYSFLLIDQKLLIDISRSNWLWETKEPAILKETSEWLQEIIGNQKKP